MKPHKSESLREIALAHDWKAEVRTDMDEYQRTGNLNEIIWNLYALRDKETMHVCWRGNRLEGGMYVYGDYHRKLWWKSEVLKFLTGKADPKKFRKITEDRVDNFDIPTRSVPWDADAPAIDIMLAVIKKEIKWVRKFDGQVCEAVVDVDLAEKGSAKHFRVYNGKTGRVLEWADALGFHAVGLDQIIDVS